MPIYAGLIAFIWLAFIIVWGVSAFSAKRTLNRAWLRGWWIRVGMAIIIVLVIRYNTSVGHGISGVVLNAPLNSVGVVLTLAGVALCIWARLYLGRNWGMPMSVKANPELVTTGPYAYIRNPIYSGVILAALGSSLINWWWLILVLGSGAYFIYSAFAEEKIMQSEFPNAYPAYKARTKRLIPFVF